MAPPLSYWPAHAEHSLDVILSCEQDDVVALTCSLIFQFGLCPANMEWVGFINYSAASHQKGVKISASLWPLQLQMQHFWC